MPTAPFLLAGDQVYFWMHGLQMLDGELTYRDFFQFTPRDTDLIYFGLFRALGAKIAVINIVVLLLGLVLCWICFRLACQILERPAAARLRTILDLDLRPVAQWHATLVKHGAHPGGRSQRLGLPSLPFHAHYQLKL